MDEGLVERGRRVKKQSRAGRAEQSSAKTVVQAIQGDGSHSHLARVTWSGQHVGAGSLRRLQVRWGGVCGRRHSLLIWLQGGTVRRSHQSDGRAATARWRRAAGPGVWEHAVPVQQEQAM